jgi:PAS domain S-box-containing protein
VEFFSRLFDTSDFPARWACGRWSIGHGWLHVLSDLAVWSAYFAIPLVFGYFLARRKDLPFRSIVLLFAAFIVLCGTTHLMEAVIFWWPAYRLAGVLKLLTAVVSWLTVFALVRTVPAILSMRSPGELERLVRERTAESEAAVAALRAERELLRTTLISIGDAVITTDAGGRVTLMNPVAETLTGWTQPEAAGRPLAEFFRTVNETTRQPVDNPALRPLKEGTVVGLANRTVLIAKDGTERPIDDSTAPIRDAAGRVVGVVLVFHDIADRKRAEDELRQSEARFRAGIEAVSSIVWTNTAQGTMAGEQPGWGAFTGQDRESYQGYGWSRAVHPDDAQPTIDAWHETVAAKKTFVFEHRVRRGDGQWRLCSIRAVPVFDGQGEIAEWVGVHTDITERKEAEEERRASELRHAFLVTLADTLRPLSDPTAVQAEASRVLGERLGANRVAYFEVRGEDYVVERDYADAARSVVGRYPVASFGPDQLALFLAGRTASEADVDALPARSPEERGAFAALQVRSYVGVPLIKGGAFVAGLAVHSTRPRAWTPTEVATIKDTAERTWVEVERVRAEGEVARLAAEAERERRLFAAVLSNTPDFIYTFDLGGRFVYVNAPLLALWGKGLHEAVGRDFFDLDYPPALADRFQRQIRQVIDTRQSLRDETPYSGVAGKREYEYIFVPVLGAGGAVEAVAGSTRDITDRKRAEEELKRLAAALSDADRRKDEFLATLAHELRNPLAPIRNGLQVIRLAGANGTVEKARVMMDRQLTQLVRLVDDLLDVSRITQGKLDLRIERVEIRAVIDAAVETSRPAIEQAGHELVVAVPDEAIFVDGDAARLAQVVSNLLNNSAKYTHRGGHIRLTVTRDGGSVAVSVADDGIGIPPAMLDKVFVMFTQVDRTLEKTTGGLGIGLSLVKGLVEMHGGTIEPRSEGEGKGSEFVVRLPVAVPVGTEPDAASGQADEVVPSVRRRILVVDDNADAADSLGQLLEMLGNEVRTAYDGEAGVGAAATFRPDVVLMDIGMPKMNGYEAGRCIREQPWGRSMVLVALTGWGQEDDRQKSSAAGFDHHLVKPVEFAALTKLLAGLEKATA